MRSAARDVLAALDAFDAACESGDAEALVALFVADEDITFWGSAGDERAVGPDELRALARAIASASGSFRVEWTERRASVGGDVAWVNAAGLAFWDPGDGELRELPYRMTGVLLRRDASWRWHTFHGSEPQED